MTDIRFTISLTSAVGSMRGREMSYEWVTAAAMVVRGTRMKTLTGKWHVSYNATRMGVVLQCVFLILIYIYIQPTLIIAARDSPPNRLYHPVSYFSIFRIWY